MTVPALRPLSVGEILDTSFGMYRRLFAPLVAISLACSALPAAISIFLESGGGALVRPGLYLTNVLFSVILSALATAATVHLVSAGYLGRTLSAGEAIAKAVPLIWQIFLVSLSLSIVIGLGFLLLVIPGIIALCGYALSTQALVIESLPYSKAMSRSWALTQGHRWRMLGLLFVAGLIIGVAVGGLAVVAGLFAGAAVAGGLVGNKIISLILINIMSIVAYPYVYCVLTVAYYDLRVRKEGFDLELLASALQTA